MRLAPLLALFYLPLVLIAAGVGVAFAVGGVSGGLVTLVVLLGLATFLLSIPFGIIVAFAQRALAVEGVGARGSLRAGWEILRANVGPSLLAWLVLIALSIAATIGVIVALLIAAVPLGLLGVVFYAGGGGVGLGIYAAVVLLAAFGALMVLIAVTNTFTWHFWSLVYLRARDRLLASPAP